MGKKRRSKFIQNQRYENHRNNKAMTGTYRKINKTQKEINTVTKDFEKSIQDEFNKAFEVNNLESPEFNVNSRICIFEAIKKKIIERKEKFLTMIDTENIVPQNQAVIDMYDLNIECIENIYTFGYLKVISVNDEDNLEELYNQCVTKLESYEKLDFNKLTPLDELKTNLQTILTEDEMNKLLIKLFKFININDNPEKYYLFIDNTIKNLLYITNADPLNKILVKNIKLL